MNLNKLLKKINWVNQIYAIFFAYGMMFVFDYFFNLPGWVLLIIGGMFGCLTIDKLTNEKNEPKESS